MAINVEIKARVSEPDRLRQVVETLCGSADRVLRQEDIFFRTTAGRLKLRFLEPRLGQLIYYQRPDQPGPSESQYFISKTNDPASLKTVLEHGLGIRGVVKKQRRVFLHGQTRIHLDLVENLGSYLELEVSLRPGQDAEEGHRIAHHLMDHLGVEEADLVPGAYIDLLEEAEL